ncbi:unnamed protein product, partial [marine sediment metagenome]
YLPFVEKIIMKNKVAGMALISIRKTNFGFLFGNISNLIVDPSYRGEGLGEINHLNQQLEKSKTLQDKIKEFEEQLIKRERENVEITKSSMAKEEIVKRVEQKLELAQKESVKKSIEIENLKINFEKELGTLKAKENSYLDNIQILKMENSRMEKESGKLKDEIIDLKKKIKVLRRGSS